MGLDLCFWGFEKRGSLGCESSFFKWALDLLRRSVQTRQILKDLIWILALGFLAFAFDFRWVVVIVYSRSSFDGYLLL